MLITPQSQGLNSWVVSSQTVDEKRDLSMYLLTGREPLCCRIFIH